MRRFVPNCSVPSSYTYSEFLPPKIYIILLLDFPITVLSSTKMKYLQYCISALITFLVCFEQCSALKCYECNSATDKRCLGDENNKLSDDLKITCLDKSPNGDHPYILCRKIEQVIDFEVNGLKPDSRIIRTCGWDKSSHHNKCYHRSGFGGRQEVCSCEGDGCNGSSTIYTSLTLMTSLLILLKMYM